jgi:hypothetical protein
MRHPDGGAKSMTGKQGGHMQKFFVILGSFMLAGTLAAAQKEAPKGLSVEKAVAATGVENREPVGEATEFEASAGKVYCWTKVLAETVPTKVKHVWYVDNQQVFEISLDINYPSTRTWSTKTVTAGSWRVDVTDETGTVLTSVSFTVK